MNTLLLYWLLSLSPASVGEPSVDANALAPPGLAVLSVRTAPGGGTRVVLGDGRPALLVDVTMHASAAAAQDHLRAWLGNVSRRLEVHARPGGELARTAGLWIERRGPTLIVVSRVGRGGNVRAAAQAVWDATLNARAARRR